MLLLEFVIVTAEVGEKMRTSQRHFSSRKQQCLIDSPIGKVRCISQVIKMYFPEIGCLISLKTISTEMIVKCIIGRVSHLFNISTWNYQLSKATY